MCIRTRELPPPLKRMSIRSGMGGMGHSAMGWAPVPVIRAEEIVDGIHHSLHRIHQVHVYASRVGDTLMHVRKCLNAREWKSKNACDVPIVGVYIGS